MRVKEMFKGIELLEEQILRDYSSKPLNTKKILSSINFDSMLDTESLSRMLFESSPDTQINSRGYRLLEKLNLTEREIKSLVYDFDSFSSIMEASEEELGKILKAKAASFKKELDNLKEQVLLGKKI
jgi:DNA integrity scanning protein DisA with diadenylate cyclase activity